jgi:hypothetical protein
MLQLVYVSSATGTLSFRDREAILAASQRNNSAADITGLLYSDGKRFLQVLEGPEEAVQTTYDRIKGDTRHNAVVILSRRDIQSREFGNWAMAARSPGADPEMFIERVKRLTEQASPSVRATFQSFAEVRRAA